MRKSNPPVTAARRGRIIVASGDLSKNDRAALDYAAEVGLILKWRAPRRSTERTRGVKPFEVFYGAKLMNNVQKTDVDAAGPRT